MHQVLDEWYGIQDRHQLMLEACELNLVSEENYLDLGMAGLGSCLLGGLPDWVVAYLACLKEEGSFVKEVLQCIAPHVEEGILNDLKSKIHAHDPSGSNDIQKSLL
nr:histone-lysine n-methyltransferase atxr3 [Quercus suber]